MTVQAGLCQTRSETPNTGHLTSWLIKINLILSVECMRITVGEISSIAARCKTGIFELKRYDLACYSCIVLGAILFMYNTMHE